MTSLLVVDDSAADEACYRAFLGKLDVEPLFCASGAEALRLASAPGAAARGIIVLFELPGQPSGAELLAHLHRQNQQLPILVVSGLLDLSRAAKARALGARDFLLKPLERDRFCAAVRALLADRPESPLAVELRGRLIASAPAFLQTLDELAAVIPLKQEPILLIGENGTGKELLARAVHDLSNDKGKPWTPVNIASIPAALIESTLFGHEAGAFTDARERRVGLFEECGAGTLFLDEIGELDSALQVKLLRVIQERVFRRVGGSADLQFHARLVCATNRDLVKEQQAGKFREDLYHRLATHEIRVPPLRQRGEDLPLLIRHFLKKHGAGRAAHLAVEARMLLEHYPFPGNVRELEALLQDALAKCDGTEILPYHLPLVVMAERTASALQTDRTAEFADRLLDLPYKDAIAEVIVAFDRIYLQRRLDAAGGILADAAEAAQLDTKTFRKHCREAGLKPPPGGE
jgi:DNA-binding NtrC family response regulator